MTSSQKCNIKKGTLNATTDTLNYPGVDSRTKFDSRVMVPKKVVKPFERKHVNSRLMSTLFSSTMVWPLTD